MNPAQVLQQMSDAYRHFHHARDRRQPWSSQDHLADTERDLREHVAEAYRAIAALDKQKLTPDQTRVRNELVVVATLAEGSLKEQAAR